MRELEKSIKREKAKEVQSEETCPKQRGDLKHKTGRIS